MLSRENFGELKAEARSQKNGVKKMVAGNGMDDRRWKMGDRRQETGRGRERCDKVVFLR